MQELPVINKKENRVARSMRTIMYVALAICPFGMGLPAVWPDVTGQAWNTQRIPAFILAGTLFAGSFFAWYLVPEKTEKKKAALFCPLLFLAALSIRLFTISLLQAKPVSDFLTCYEYAANGSGDAEYLAQYPYLGAYALTLRLFFHVFGRSVWNAQALNALMTSCIPVALYLAASRVTGKENIGVAAGYFYAVFPSMAIYTAVPSCEHFSQFYLSLAACAFAFYCTEGEMGGRKWMFGILTGILIGCTCVYKNILLLIAPAFLLAGLCYEVLQRQKNFLPILRNLAMLAAAILVSQAGTAYVQNKLAGPQFQSNGTLSAAIYKGLSTEGNGVWDSKVQQYIEQVLAEHEDKGEIDRIFYGKLAEEYAGRWQELPRLLYHKYEIDWCSEDYYHWTFSGEGNIVQGTWIGEVLFVIVPRIFMMLVGIAISLGLLIGVFKEGPTEKQHFLFFCTGVLSLFAAALALIEAQCRYKSNIMPLICILCSICVDGLLGSMPAFCRFIRKKVKKQ